MSPINELVDHLAIDPCDNDTCDRLVIRQSSWRSLSKANRSLLREAGFAGHGARGLCSPCYRKVFKRSYNPNDPLVVDAYNIAAEHQVFPPKSVAYTAIRKYDAEEWTADAACNTTDPEAFFLTNKSDIAAVKGICASCPVRVECLLSAIRRREEYGVWGGLTENELAVLYTDLDALRPENLDADTPQPRGLVPDDEGFVSVPLADLTSEFDNQHEAFVDEEGVPFA